MARVTRMVIGEKHFSSPVMGFSFIDSVCVPEEEIDELHIRIRRLQLLFPGTQIETTDRPVKETGKEKEADSKVKEKAAEKAKREEAGRKAREKAAYEEAMRIDEANGAAEAETAEEKTSAEAVVEEKDNPDDTPDLAEGLRVMCEYEGEICKGTVVGVFESGVVRVKIDDDEAAYRVLERISIAPAD